MNIILMASSGDVFKPSKGLFRDLTNFIARTGFLHSFWSIKTPLEVNHPFGEVCLVATAVVAGQTDEF